MNSFFFERLLVTSRVFTYDNVRRWTKGYDFFAMNQVKQLGLNRPRYCLLHFCLPHYCLLHYYQLRYCLPRYCLLHYCLLRYCLLRYCLPRYCLLH